MIDVPRPLFLLAVASLALGCSSASGGDDATTDAGAGATSYGDPLTYDVTKQGPYTCGHRVLSMTYTPTGLPSRTIPLHVWYPSTSTDGDHPKYQGLFEDTYSYEDAPYAGSPWANGKLPTLVHSHGYMGFSGNSARLLCDMASHGWLSIAPTHVGNTLSDTPKPLPLAVYVERPQDTRSALDFVAALPAGDPLAGAVDLDRVAVSGHSFGSYTTWVAAGSPVDATFAKAQCDSAAVTPCSDAELAALATDLSEKRAKAVMVLAGAPNDWIGVAGYAVPQVPMLMMDGTLNLVGNDVPFGAPKHPDLTWVTVEGGCHQLYGLGNTVYGDDTCKVLPDEEGFSLVNPWFLAYARYQVLGDRSQPTKGWVEGTTASSPKVKVQHEAAND